MKKKYYTTPLLQEVILPSCPLLQAVSLQGEGLTPATPSEIIGDGSDARVPGLDILFE